MSLILVETSKDGTKVCKSRLQKEIIDYCDKQNSATEGGIEHMKIDFLAYPEQSHFIANWLDDSETR